MKYLDFTIIEFKFNVGFHKAILKSTIYFFKILSKWPRTKNSPCFYLLETIGYNKIKVNNDSYFLQFIY